MITSLWVSSVIARLRRFIQEMLGEEPQTMTATGRHQTNSSARLMTDSGHTLRVESFVASGGQGEIYRASLQNSDQPVALKLFHKSQATATTKRRIRHLAKKKLHQLDNRICAPFDTITSDGLVGHISPFAPGETLLEVLEQGSLSYEEAFDVAQQVVSLVSTVVDCSIVHGDLQTQNFNVARTSRGLRVFMVDLDNFSAKRIPKPNMVGMTLYIAPELRKRIDTGKRAYPTEYSDRYALGVLLHEVLLHFHPISGFDITIDDINASMVSGWRYDPDLQSAPDNPHGYPVKTLDPRLIALIRRSLSMTQRKRPSSKEWCKTLKLASRSLHCCQQCGVPFVGYRNRNVCPLDHRIQHLALRLENEQVISLPGMVTVLGRHELGGSNEISRRHLIVREIGSQLCIEPIGMNPTYIRDGVAWRRLAQKQLTVLKPNDRLLVANALLQYSE